MRPAILPDSKESMHEEIDNLAILRSLQESLIQATAPNRKSAFVGSFVAMINPIEPLIYFNYAVPVVSPCRSELVSLILHFRTHDRSPRFEFFPELWPDLEAMLLKEGFELEMRIPVMVLSRLELNPREDSTVKDISTAVELLDSSRCSALAFGAEMEPSEAQIESNVQSIQSGQSRCAAVWVDGQVVSNGWTIGGGPICELAGVGTHPEHRKKGLASSVSSYLCRKRFENGGEHVWLSAGTPEAEAVYSKLGFRKIGEQVNYCLS
jgi:ribosomal protein S18 acetylase RimI-like enzyme